MRYNKDYRNPPFRYRRRTAAMAGVGAVVGGTGAAAAGIARVRAGETTPIEAARDTAVEAASAAVATGTATAVMDSLGIRNGFFNLLGTVVLATGTKYMIDTAVSTLEETLEEQRILKAIDASEPPPHAGPPEDAEPPENAEPA